MSFLSEHAVNIRFRDTWPGKILMIAAFGVLCYGSVFPLLMDTDLFYVNRGLYCAIETVLYALIAILCLVPGLWRSRWFACFIVAFWAFQAGRVLGWAIVEWISPQQLSYRTNYWLAAFPRVAAIAFLGMALLMAIPGGVMFIASGTAALIALGFALLALVWPRAALGIVCLLIMIPLGAAGAGMIGSIGFWNKD